MGTIVKMADWQGQQTDYSGKLKGELSEIRFWEQALLRGIIVCRPVGDFHEYDVITDYKGKLNRVQIKSTWKKNVAAARRGKDTYVIKVACGSKKRLYQNVDFFALHIDDISSCVDSAWYIIPSNCCGKNVSLYPHRNTDKNSSQHKTKHEKYRDRWDLLG